MILFRSNNLMKYLIQPNNHPLCKKISLLIMTLRIIAKIIAIVIRVQEDNNISTYRLLDISIGVLIMIMMMTIPKSKVINNKAMLESIEIITTETLKQISKIRSDI